MLTNREKVLVFTKHCSDVCSLSSPLIDIHRQKILYLSIKARTLQSTVEVCQAAKYDLTIE